MSSEIEKQIELLNKQIEGQKKQIAFDKKRGISTMPTITQLNQLTALRDDLIKHGTSQEEIAELRVGINEKTKIVEKLREECQILKDGLDTYNKLETGFVESAEKLLATLNL